MRRLRGIAAALLVIPIITTGCISGPLQKKGDAIIKEKNINIRDEVAFWAEIGAEAALLENPRNRVGIAAATAYLDGVERNGGTFTITEVRQALARLKELQSKDARFGILGGSAILRRYVGDIELASPELLKQGALGLRDGLKAALTGESPPPAPAPAPATPANPT